MTATSGDQVKGSAMKRLVNSMWGFWILLLVVSIGLAAAIYELWLKGSV